MSDSFTNALKKETPPEFHSMFSLFCVLSLSYAHKLCFQQLPVSFVPIIKIRSLCTLWWSFSLMAVKPLVEVFIYPLLSSLQSADEEDYSTAGFKHQVLYSLGFSALKFTAGDTFCYTITSMVILAIPWDIASTDFEHSYNYSYLIKFSFS